MEDPNGDLRTPLLPGGCDSDVILDIDRERRPAGEPGNPFEFLGAPPLVLPRPIPVDPFRNHTPSIAGIYEWFKVVLCVPIALARLVLFGLALAVGFVATKLALEGWKDKQSPMPRWRSRIMWITRISARCILFTFGSLIAMIKDLKFL
ncbi:putative lysophospholipid acyltransferase LPEAT2 [Cocos nucifera]|nr:putative lysophospholipid acyltransferase LPEAT2 [Cocos nucifera]